MWHFFHINITKCGRLRSNILIIKWALEDESRFWEIKKKLPCRWQNNELEDDFPIWASSFFSFNFRETHRAEKDKDEYDDERRTKTSTMMTEGQRRVRWWQKDKHKQVELGRHERGDLWGTVCRSRTVSMKWMDASLRSGRRSGQGKRSWKPMTAQSSLHRAPALSVPVWSFADFKNPAASERAAAPLQLLLGHFSPRESKRQRCKIKKRCSLLAA